MVKKSSSSKRSRSKSPKRKSTTKSTSKRTTLKSTTKRKTTTRKKLNKLELIDFLSKELTVDEVYDALIMLGKDKLAEEFKNEVEMINREYNRLLAELRGEKSEEEEILEKIVNKITDYLKKIYELDIKAEREVDFHKHLESFLAGAITALKEILKKFGIEANVEREYKLPSGERVDLMVTFGNIKIGIEVKMSLSETSIVQRLQGQIDDYIEYCDALIIVSYEPIKRWEFAKRIKQKAEEKGKIIKIVDRYKTL